MKTATAILLIMVICPPVFCQETTQTIDTLRKDALNVFMVASLIHDQISLLMGDASLEDVLLRRKMQATDYQYFTSFGFTYTFGSIYNNAVNPRFSF